MTHGRTNISVPKIYVKPELLYLYQEGDKCESSEGGGWDTVYSGSLPQVTWNADNVVLKQANGLYNSNDYRTLIFTKNFVDLTPYNKLCFDIQITDKRISNPADWVYVGVTPAKSITSLFESYIARWTNNPNDTVANITAERQVYELDISSITTEAYIGVLNLNLVTTTIYNIWLE